MPLSAYLFGVDNCLVGCINNNKKYIYILAFCIVDILFGMFYFIMLYITNTQKIMILAMQEVSLLKYALTW